MTAADFLRPLAVAALALSVLYGCASSTTPSVGVDVNAPVEPGYYRVQAGDTLFRIAKRWGQSVSTLVKWNNLADASQIEVGQVLRVAPPTVAANPTTTPRAPVLRPTPKDPVVTPAQAGIRLAMPVTGGKLGNFNTTTNGVDIAGAVGTPILAAAPGKVVYAGSGIRQYGNMLIIKHNKDYLTVYAHNSKLLARDGQTISTGQTIAEMGSHGGKPLLHFELRYRGKPIDPSAYFQ